MQPSRGIFLLIFVVLSQCFFTFLILYFTEPSTKDIYTKVFSSKYGKRHPLADSEYTGYNTSLRNARGNQRNHLTNDAENMKELNVQFSIFRLVPQLKLWEVKAAKTATWFSDLPYNAIEKIAVSDPIPDTQGNWKLMYRQGQAFVFVQSVVWLDTRPGLPDSPCFRIHVIAPVEYTWFLAQSQYSRYLVYVKTSSGVLKLENYTFKIVCCRRKRLIKGVIYASFLLIFKMDNFSFLNQILHGQNIKKFIFASSHYQDWPNELDVKIIKSDDSLGNRKNFFLCLKPMFGDFSAERLPFLIEWIELHRILGVEHLFMYNNSLKTSPELENILQYYQTEGYLTVKQYPTPFRSLMGASVMDEYYASSLIDVSAQTTCYYDNLHLYHYMLSVDIDEVILPLEQSNYTELFNNLKQDRSHRNATSILFRWAYFYKDDDSVKSDYTKSTVLTRRRYSLTKPWLNVGEFDDAEHYNTKAFTSTRWCAFLFNHHCRLNNPHHPMTFAPPEMAMTHHYRSKCVKTVDKGYHCTRDKQMMPVLNQVLQYEQSLKQALSEKYRRFGV